MQRITIHSTDKYGHVEIEGRFDLDKATHVATEGQKWDGNNMRGVISGLQLTRDELWRTARGRWVSHSDATREFNGPNEWKFLTEDEARDWVLVSEHPDTEDILDKYFPGTPDEEGPDPKGGRPAVGPTINVAYPPELLKRIEAAAADAGMSRAAWLRDAAEKALAA